MSANSLGGSIVIAWGVLFANSFLVLFFFSTSSFSTTLGRCVFVLFLLLQFLQALTSGWGFIVSISIRRSRSRFCSRVWDLLFVFCFFLSFAWSSE